MSKDENTGLWIIIISALLWFFGAASFGVTGGNIVTVLIVNLGMLIGPFAALFGVVLMVKGQVIRWRKGRPDD